jgi:hypothetical protein
MQKHVCSLINSAVPAKQFGPRTGSHQRWSLAACHLTSIRCRTVHKTCCFLPTSHIFPLRLRSQSWVPNYIQPSLCMWDLLSIHEATDVIWWSQVCVCVCVCVYVCAGCMTWYDFPDDGLIIQLWKCQIFFHIGSCYPLRSFHLQLTVSLFYLLTNTLLVSCIDNV